MTAPTVIGADDISEAIERTLRANIPRVKAALELEEELDEIQTWQQVPIPAALAAAALPAVAIIAPSMTSEARRNATTYDGVWQTSVIVVARGTDHKHTQQQIQKWAKVVRVAALLTPALDGLAVSLRWVGEQYDLEADQATARTLAGCEVFFDAIAETSMDLSQIRSTITAAPTVTATDITVTPSN